MTDEEYAKQVVEEERKNLPARFAEARRQPNADLPALLKAEANALRFRVMWRTSFFRGDTSPEFHAMVEKLIRELS